MFCQQMSHIQNWAPKDGTSYYMKSPAELCLCEIYFDKNIDCICLGSSLSQNQQTSISSSKHCHIYCIYNRET
jgi:hypothetical protein